MSRKTRIFAGGMAVLLVAIAGFSLVSAHFRWFRDRIVTVTIIIQDRSGTPLAGCSAHINAELKDPDYGLTPVVHWTNSSGRTIQVAPPGATSITVSCLPPWSDLNVQKNVPVIIDDADTQTIVTTMP